MSSRSLNKVILIGNLTRDPELRYTPAGTAVCTFGLATNRAWTTQTGETKEETEFHRIVAWNKLGELCAQLLAKGRKTYVEGRLTTRSWTAADGVQRTSTEIVIEDMIILDSKRIVYQGEEMGKVVSPPVVSEKAEVTKTNEEKQPEDKKAKKGGKKSGEKPEEDKPANETITPDDIPF